MWRASSSDLRAAALKQAFAEATSTPTPAAHHVHAALPQQQPPRASFEVPEDIELLRLKLGGLPKALRQHVVALSSQPGGGTHSGGHGIAGMHADAQRGQTGAALARQQQEEQDRTYEQWRMQHPSALQCIDDIYQLLRGKRLAVFLDYDGTLTPIVSNPDDALLSQQMREVVRNVARLFPTAIISGRGREKVENFVQLKELYYAGSHGMDIAGPSGLGSDSNSTSPVDAAFQPAAHFRPLIDNVYKQLCERLATIPGASVEHNTFCVSAHFRNCSADRWKEVVEVVEQIVAVNPELRLTRGRKVVEIRPKVNWHKGTALDHLLGVLGLRSRSDVVALYIGDDHTDEDAFRVLRETQQGFGVLVSTKARETAAVYTVRDPSEVQLFLQALVQWGSTEHNGWPAFLFGPRRSPSGNGRTISANGCSTIENGSSSNSNASTSNGTSRSSNVSSASKTIAVTANGN